MAIPKPASLKDFFNFVGNSVQQPQTGFSLRTMTLPNNGGNFQTQTPTPQNAPVAPAPAPNAPAPVAPAAPTPIQKKPVFSGSTMQAPAQAAPVQIPPQWIEPDGSFYTPDEVAANIASTAPKNSTNGDIPKFSGDQFANPNMTAEELMTHAANLNNARNDIAVGETDPYKVAADSGIAYTPSELSAIEKAYAGIYDPAINSALAKLDAKQKEDANKQELANDLKKMEVQFEYDKKLKSIGGGAGGSNPNQIIDNERAAQTLFQNNPIVKDYNTVVSQKNALDRVVANGVGGPADVNAVFNFMKALDPNSVVRESEYDKAAKSGNLFQGQFAKFNGYFKDKGGFLPANVREEFQSLINQKLAAQKAQYDNIANQTRAIVQRQGLNPDNVVIDFSGGIENLQPQNASSGVDTDWLSKPDYNNDLKLAKDAIAAGADPKAVKARLLLKYKQVDL